MAGFTEKEALNELVGSGTAIPKINMKFDSNNNSGGKSGGVRHGRA